MNTSVEKVTSLYNKLKKKFITVKKERDSIAKRNLVLQRSLKDKEKHIRELKLEKEDILCSRNGTQQNRVAYD